MAEQVIAHHVDRLARQVARNVERVAALAADGADRRPLGRAGDEELVVALQGIDDDVLDRGIGHEQAGAVDASVGHHELVGEFRTHHDQRVGAVTAVDMHRRVHGVGNQVLALAAIDVGDRLERVVRVDRDEGAHREGVVVLFAVEEDIGLVVVNREGVVARAAVHEGVKVDAVAEVAARGQRGLELVFRREAGIGVARRLEYLSDLEGVGAGVAVDGQRGTCVVQREDVVAIAAEHRDATAHRGVVDALDAAARDPIAVGVSLQGDDRMRPEQEQVVLVRAVHVHPIRPEVGRVGGGTVHHDPRLRRVGRRVGEFAREPDLEQIVVLAAADGEQRCNAVVEGLPAVLAVVDADDVLAAEAFLRQGAGGGNPVAVGRGHTRDRTDVDDVISKIAIDDVGRGVRALDKQVVRTLAKDQVEVVDARVVEADRHAQPGHARHVGGKPGGVNPPGKACRCCTVVDSQGVARLGAAGDVDLFDDADEGMRCVAHRDGVAAKAGIYGRTSRHRLNQDVVGPVLRAQVAAVRVGTCDREAVHAAAQVEVQRLDIAVGDAGGAESAHQSCR